MLQPDKNPSTAAREDSTSGTGLTWINIRKMAS